MQFRLFAALVTCALVAGSAIASPDRIKLLEGPAALAKLTPEQQKEDGRGYLTADPVAIAAAMLAAPASDSPADKADVALFQEMYRSASAERFKTAQDDDATMYGRFNDQLGLALDREHLPTLVTLLNRVAADAFAVTSEAKKRYSRPRPYQRLKLKRVCGFDRAPAPEASPTKGTSYPSGHASVSWSVALVLMEVAPASAQAIIGRAVSYGNSRVVCGLHFPADIEAGHYLGSAVVARLFESPEFVHDLKCARREFEAVAAGETSADLPACAP
ncbi:MAG: phosphatase PAP2 family protein [Micropepsaceae bacterium]